MTDETTHFATARAADAGLRLDKFLATALPAISRSRLKALILQDRVGAGGETISDPSYGVKPGQRFELRVPPPADATPAPQAIALDIPYEDDDLIVVDKPAGLVVHPAPGNPDRTLVNALLAHCGASLSGVGGVRRPGIVHRLDKETSGLMVAAKTDRAHRALAAAFAAHTIDRQYLALVWGAPVPRAGTIDAAIGRDPRQRKRMSIRRSGGKPAITRYRVERVLGAAEGGPASLVRCTLETGRTHQIRVHLASLGHAVIGDALYGRATRARRGQLSAVQKAALSAFRRNALHAAVLGFTHPVSGDKLRFDAPMPAEMAHLMTLLDLAHGG